MSYQYDHRLLADEMEIFFLDEQIGAGLPIWLPHGVAIRDELEAFVKKLEDQQGYQRVVSPHLAKAELYEQSGHLRSFDGNMFPPLKNEDECFYLKPMNCPHHHKVFASSLRSFRQLPFRIAEYGQVYRYENSGSLRGLSRVRGLCQNDAHIYLDPKDSKAELLRVLDLHEYCYRAIGLKGYRYRLSLHDPEKKSDYDGDAKDWEVAEEHLRQALRSRQLPFFEAKGEAAFYGPKIDVQMKMGSGQEESVASVQLDFNSAKKFDLSFIASSGEKVQPWVIHRAPLGSHERFVALLLEYFDGQLPAWLCPLHLQILPVDESHKEFAQVLVQQLLNEGLRVRMDLSQGSLAKRLHFSHRYRSYASVVVGDLEVKSKSGSLQLRQGQKQRIEFSKLASFLKDEIIKSKN